MGSPTAAAPDAAALTQAEAVALCHAFVDQVAADIGARVLFIKGPGLTAQGLRGQHASVDADVLVAPDDQARLLAALDRHGWRPRGRITGGLVLPLHSTTLRHEGWGNELDVHDRFPGFLSDPGPVFEALWERRTTVRVAGRDVPCPDPVSHGVIAALHWLRDGDAYHQAQLLNLCVRLGERLDATGRADLASFAARTGAVGPLTPVLDRLGITPPATEATYDDTDWRIRTASAGLKSVGWVVELRRTPLRRKPARLWRAMVLTEAEIRREQPDAAPGTWGLLRARAHRLRYGLRALPRAVRIVRRERRLA